MLLAAVVDDPSKVSPGIIGFLVTFALALATWFLLRNMVGRLRRLRSRPDPAAEDDATTAVVSSSTAGTSAKGASSSKGSSSTTGTAKRTGARPNPGKKKP